MFQIQASVSGQPASTFIGDIPTLAGNKPVGSLMLGAGGGRIDLAELDRLTDGTDGPFMPSAVKLFLNSSLQVQGPGMVEDLGWTALVWGVRGFPPSKGVTDSTVLSSSQRKKDYRLDLQGHDEVQKAHSKVLAENQSLSFVPTVCIAEYTGPVPGHGRGQGNNTENGVNGTKKQNFYTDFANWLDADFWRDIPSKSGMSFLDGKIRLLCAISISVGLSTASAISEINISQDHSILL